MWLQKVWLFLKKLCSQILTQEFGTKAGLITLLLLPFNNRLINKLSVKNPLRTFFDVLSDNQLLDKAVVQYEKNGASEKIIVSFDSSQSVINSNEVEEWFKENDTGKHKRHSSG